MISKYEIRKSIFHSSGCDADDWLDGSKQASNAFEGAKKALRKSSQEVLSVANLIKKDLDEGNLDGLESAQIADYAVLQVKRASELLVSGAKHYENMQLTMQGEISAYERVVTHFKSLHDKEEAKQKALLDAVDSGEIELEDGEMVGQGRSGRITGVRPAASLSARRKAESDEKSSAEDDTSGNENPSEETKKKRKKRKSKDDKTEVTEPEDGENT